MIRRDMNLVSNMRQVLIIVLALLLANLLGVSRPVWAAQQAADGKQISSLLIGAVLPLSGSQSSYGQEVQTGLELALVAWKRHHSIVANRIKLVVADDQSKPSMARLAAEKLVKQRVSVLIGSVSTWTTAAVASVAKTNAKPLVVPALCQVSQVSNLSFRGCYSSSWQGSILARFLISNLGKKNVALYLDREDSAAESAGTALQHYLEANGAKIAVRHVTDHAAENMRQLLGVAKSSGADVIVALSSHAKFYRSILESAAAENLTLPFLATEEFREVNAQVVAKYRGTNYYAFPYHTNAPTEMSQEFVADFRRKLRRDPSPLAAMAYDSMVAVMSAYQSAQTNRPAELSRALSRLKNAPGLLGTMSMSTKGFLEKAGTILSRGQTSRVQAKFQAVVAAPGA